MIKQRCPPGSIYRYILPDIINMTSLNTVALIGGTGKAGQYVLNYLLAQNISVKLLHRNPDTLQVAHPLLRVVKGDARNAADIQQLLVGCTAVISCLGQPAGEQPIFSTASTNVLSAMKENAIGRYILLAGLNVDTPTDQKGPQTQAATNWMKQHYPATCADRQAEYEQLAQSDADWTLVRIPMLIQTDELSDTIIDLKDCPGQQISSASLAKFLTDQLTDERYHRQAPFIANS